MNVRVGLLFGPLGALIMLVGVVGLALMVPGYSHVHQTVSEIGEMDSPARIPFAVMLCLVAACLLVFAFAVHRASVEAGWPSWGAYFIGYMAIPCVGVGIFAFPHPLHNVFGLSETIGYLAPLLFALSWHKAPGAKPMVIASWIGFVLVLIAIGLNMSGLDRTGELWALVKPVMGLAQRMLFASWFGWAAVLGWLLYRQQK